MNANIRQEDAGRAARNVADRWRILTGLYVTDAGGRITIRATAQEADDLLDDVVRGRAATFFDGEPEDAA